MNINAKTVGIATLAVVAASAAGYGIYKFFSKSEEKPAEKTAEPAPAATPVKETV